MTISLRITLLLVVCTQVLSSQVTTVEMKVRKNSVIMSLIQLQKVLGRLFSLISPEMNTISVMKAAVLQSTKFNKMVLQPNLFLKKSE